MGRTLSRKNKEEHGDEKSDGDGDDIRAKNKIMHTAKYIGPNIFVYIPVKVIMNNVMCNGVIYISFSILIRAQRKRRRASLQ